MVGLLVGVNLIYALSLPIFALFLFDPASLLPLNRRRWRSLVAFVAPLAAVLGAIALFKWIHFGNPFSAYHFAEGEGFNRPLLLGIFGLTISPFRGLFWYNPLLLLALPGWWVLRRVHSRMAYLIAALCLLQIAGFAGWWSWHGGVVWGPRFLVPIVPLMTLALAALVRGAYIGSTGRRLFLGTVILSFFGLSLAIQLLGSSYSLYVFQAYLGLNYGSSDWNAPVSLLSSEVIYNPGLSPIVGQYALARARWFLEPAWIAHGLDAVHLLLALALVVAGTLLGLIWRSLRIRPGVLAVVAAAVVALDLGAVAAHQSALLKTDRVRRLTAELQPDAAIVSLSSGYNLDLIDLPYASPVLTINLKWLDGDPLTTALMSQTLARNRQFWIISDIAAENSPAWQEQLRQSGGVPTAEKPVDGGEAILYALPEATMSQTSR